MNLHGDTADVVTAAALLLKNLVRVPNAIVKERRGTNVLTSST